MEKDYQAGHSVQRRTELFNRYVLPHRNLVYKLCVRYSRAASEVEDNYSEALANFFKYIETHDPARSIQPWLHTVTKRFVCDMNRRNRALLKRSDDVDVSQMPAMAGEMETGEAGLDMDNYRLFYSDDVLDALNRLKPIYRESLLLQQAGYRLNEIMEISFRNGNLKTRNIETVKSRLFLAKQQMRRLIDRNGERRKD
jgi:RNA polymerase sigma factor (sigma-70 family)